VSEKYTGYSHSEGIPKGNVKPRRGFFADSLRFGGVALGASVAFSIGLTAAVESDIKNAERELGEAKDSYVPHNPVEVSGKMVDLVGVSHIPSVFAEHEVDIRKRIKASHSPFIVLEAFSPAIQEIAHPVKGKNKKRVSNHLSKKYPPQIYEEYTRNFFAGIASICAEEGKDILVVNPEADYGLSQVPDAVLDGVILPALVVTDLAQLWRRARKKPLVSRRNALRTAGYAAAAYNIASWVGDSKESADPWRWNYIDWRDASSSLRLTEALHEIGSEIPENAVVPMFEGSFHSEGFLNYLKNPTLAANKTRFAYAHYNLTDKSAPSRYTYDKDREQWLKGVSVKG